MATELHGSVALVTGASSGIGEAIARDLAGRGATVALAARRAERLEALASEIRSNGGTALVLAADLSDRDEATSTVDRTVAEFGRLDIVVNNAGLMVNGPTLELELDVWDRMVDINVKALMAITRVALPHLLAAAEDSPRGVADLVNISSVAGRNTGATVAAYNATKHAVTAFSDAIRKEFAAKDVRVTVIEPGTVESELLTHNSAAMQEMYAKAHASIEKLTSADIADLVGYALTRPRRVGLSEIVVRPSRQQ